MLRDDNAHAAHCTSRCRRVGLPCSQPRQRAELVNEPLSEAGRTKIESSLKRGRPLGSDGWTSKIAAKLGLAFTLNPRGRPKRKDLEHLSIQRQRCWGDRVLITE